MQTGARARCLPSVSSVCRVTAPPPPHQPSHPCPLAQKPRSQLHMPCPTLSHAPHCPTRLCPYALKQRCCRNPSSDPAARCASVCAAERPRYAEMRRTRVRLERAASVQPHRIHRAPGPRRIQIREEEAGEERWGGGGGVRLAATADVRRHTATLASGLVGVGIRLVFSATVKSVAVRAAGIRCDVPCAVHCERG